MTISVATVETTSATASANPCSRKQAEILHHADARGHEQKRQGGEQPSRRLAEIARRQRLLVEGAPALVEAEGDHE